MGKKIQVPALAIFVCTGGFWGAVGPLIDGPRVPRSPAPRTGSGSDPAGPASLIPPEAGTARIGDCDRDHQKYSNDNLQIKYRGAQPHLSHDLSSVVSWNSVHICTHTTYRSHSQVGWGERAAPRPTPKPTPHIHIRHLTFATTHAQGGLPTGGWRATSAARPFFSPLLVEVGSDAAQDVISGGDRAVARLDEHVLVGLHEEG